MNQRLSIVLTMMVLLVIAASCSYNIDVQRPESQGETITIKAVRADDDASRTSLVEGSSVWWNPGDDLSLFYGSGAAGGSRFTADITEPSPIANFTGIIDVVTGGGEISMEDTWFWATYPYNANASCDGSSIVTELPCSQVGKAGTFSDKTFITVAKSQGLLMSFYNVCSGLKFSVTNPEVKSVRIKSNGGEPIAGKARVAFDASGVPYISEVLEGKDEITISAPDGGCFEAGQNYYITMLPQTLESGFTVTFETWYEQGTREIAKKATFKRAVFNTMASADKDVTYVQKPSGIEYVDLGLSVKWASCNLGASKPEDYGGYYQWGGIQDITNITINWSNCPYHLDNDKYNGWTKYTFFNSSIHVDYSRVENDNKKYLDPDDDAAYIKFGRNWRIPTQYEWDELQNTNNCTWIWTSQNGINGYKVISKYTGNSIFLPAAGTRISGTVLQNIGSAGRYNSLTLDINNPHQAYYLTFDSDSLRTKSCYRYQGCPIRPILADATKVYGVGLNTSTVKLPLFSNIRNTYKLTVNIYPETAIDKTVVWKSSDNSVAVVDKNGVVTAIADGIATITVNSADGNHTASCKVVVDKPATPDMVDLGLSVKWASFNLGASRPEEYGGYYQWAGTVDVTSAEFLEWGNCPYHIGTDCYNGWTKYIYNYSNSSGNSYSKTVLESEDDVAYATLGENWHMPRKDEWEELVNIDNCTWIWTSQNGINGYKVTSKKTGNSIFLPTAGIRTRDYLYNCSTIGGYWSSTPFVQMCAYGLYFDSDTFSTDPYYHHYRCDGLSIRPVYGERVDVTGINIENTSINLVVGDAKILSANIIPSDATNKNVIWSSSSKSVVKVDASGKVTAVGAGTATITVKTIDGSYSASCSVTVKQPVTPDMVDLGLPSGLKWASFNLGATKPEEYGGYYQWAGLQDVTDTSIYLDWNNCPYHSGPDENTGWTKYVPSDKSSFWSGSGAPDNKTVLDPEDDIAHMALGGKWRMPTSLEWQELYTSCTSEWTTLNGVNGRRFISNKNGNSIFLPATGKREYDRLISSSYGYYWSSVDGLSPCVATIFGFSSNSDDTKMYIGNRYEGRSVRPVSDFMWE